MGISAVIFGCSGHHLTEEERDFFRRVQPWGFILFGRNIDHPDQVANLVDELKSCVDHTPVPVLIDQEGGRVRRLRPPHWQDYYSAAEIGHRYAVNKEQGLRMAWLQSRLMAFDFIKLGINVDCMPVLDIPVAGSHDVIGDRAYGDHVSQVSMLAGAAAEGLLDGSVLPVVKHTPGHGRAQEDSHLALPCVDADLEALKATDFMPFQNLSHLPLAMTAHVVYAAVDPTQPATTSSVVIQEIIRDHIGFDGLLMCDDLAMHALSGDFGIRVQSAFAAGCDVVLHCNGTMPEMQEVAAHLPKLTGKAEERAEQALSLLEAGSQGDEALLRAEFSDLGKAGADATDPTEVLM